MLVPRQVQPLLAVARDARVEPARLQRPRQVRDEVGAARQKVEVLGTLRSRKGVLSTRREESRRQIARHKALERAFGKDGVPRFSLLQKRGEPGAVPASLILFDCLEKDGAELVSRPLAERRAALESLLGPLPRKPLALSERLGGDGAKAFKRALAEGWEGVIAKRRAHEERDADHGGLPDGEVGA